MTLEKFSTKNKSFPFFTILSHSSLLLLLYKLKTMTINMKREEKMTPNLLKNTSKSLAVWVDFTKTIHKKKQRSNTHK